MHLNSYYPCPPLTTGKDHKENMDTLLPSCENSSQGDPRSQLNKVLLVGMQLLSVFPSQTPHREALKEDPGAVVLQGQL